MCAGPHLIQPIRFLELTAEPGPSKLDKDLKKKFAVRQNGKTRRQCGRITQRWGSPAHWLGGLLDAPRESTAPAIAHGAKGLLR